MAAALLVAVSACGGAATVTEPVTEPVESTTESQEPQPVESTAVAPITEAPGATAEDDGHLRPADISLTLSGTHTNSDGTYASSGAARICGNAMINMTGDLHAFNFEWPYEGEHEIIDVAFGARELSSGTSTPLFSVNVSVHAKDGGQPPAYVLHPDQTESGDTGTAQRSDEGGTTRLVVRGTNDFGESLDMTVTCGPRTQ
jgi:hypothetical protein